LSIGSYKLQTKDYLVRL